MPEIEPLVLEGELMERGYDYEGAEFEVNGVTLYALLKPLFVRSLDWQEQVERGLSGDTVTTYGRVRITVERLSDE